ncbi:hypothetical protein BU17DRAFT_61799 [Hysterangium stoloniferum]|nr:hypothetical protein BU17DRAFT_61799 [Hysterangium stoloniferum]
MDKSKVLDAKLYGLSESSRSYQLSSTALCSDFACGLPDLTDFRPLQNTFLPYELPSSDFSSSMSPDGSLLLLSDESQSMPFKTASPTLNSNTLIKNLKDATDEQLTECHNDAYMRMKNDISILEAQLSTLKAAYTQLVSRIPPLQLIMNEPAGFTTFQGAGNFVAPPQEKYLIHVKEEIIVSDLQNSASPGDVKPEVKASRMPGIYYPPKKSNSEFNVFARDYKASTDQNGQVRKRATRDEIVTAFNALDETQRRVYKAKSDALKGLKMSGETYWNPKYSDSGLAVASHSLLPDFAPLRRKRRIESDSGEC